MSRFANILFLPVSMDSRFVVLRFAMLPPGAEKEQVGCRWCLSNGAARARGQRLTPFVQWEGDVWPLGIRLEDGRPVVFLIREAQQAPGGWGEISGRLERRSRGRADGRIKTKRQDR
jgi:hypothetical protein